MFRLILPAFVLGPAAASACDMAPAMGGGAHMGAHGCGGAAPLVAMALISALGVWILRLVDKDGPAVRRTGQAVGWTLAAVGLFGFLCGAVAYGMGKARRSCHAASGANQTLPEALPPGHPPVSTVK